jgi:hypothetical protein
MVSLSRLRAIRPVVGGRRSERHSETAGRVLLLTAFCLLLFAAPVLSAEPPTATINPVIPTTGTTAEVSGELDIHEGEATVFVLEWSADGRSWSGDSDAKFIKSVPAGTLGPVPFTVVVEGLEPETTYFFRVTPYVNEVEGVSSPKAPPYPSATTGAPPLIPPVIEAEAAVAILPEAATLTATINPEHFPTTYTFEYALRSVIESPEGWSAPGVRHSPEMPEIPKGNMGEPASYGATGLVSGEEYSWRVSAKSLGGTVVGEEKNFTTQALSAGPFTGCPNEPFRVGFGAFLPDCRAYEQVTPTDKNGVGAEGLADWLVASPDPNAPRAGFINTAATGIPVAGEGGRQEFTPIVSSLEGSSWVTRRSFPPESAQARSAWYRGSSENLGYALVEVSSDPNARVSLSIKTLELLDVATGSVSSIATTPTAVDKGTFFSDSIADDGSYVFFETSSPVAPGAQSGVIDLYKWDRATDSTSVVGIVPTGSGEAAPSGGAFGAAYAWESSAGEPLSGNTSSGGASVDQYVEAIHAVSPNGSQIYFTASLPEGPASPYPTAQLYLRSGLDGPAATTVRVSEPNEGVVDPAVEREWSGVPRPAAFQEATPDGSKAFFLSSQHLTADSSTGFYDTGTDLYRYDADAPKGERLSDITGGLEEAGFEEGAHVLGLLGASADGTSGYFVARENILGSSEAGSLNIYRFEEEEDGGFQLKFVSPLDNQEEPYFRESYNWSKSTFVFGSEGSGGPLASKSSRVSVDGETLLFTSLRSITGYDNDGCGGTTNPTGPCPEVFLYSNDSGKVECLSCNPTGESPRGGAALTANYLNVTHLQLPEAVAVEAHLTRNLSSDGDQVFFQTPDSLSARDENGADCQYLKHSPVSELALPTCMDVYEWEAVGAPGGSCSKVEVNGGCLYLLSSGQSSEPSDFVDASADGSNVFIATSSRLVPADRDAIFDLYDVRTGGGLAGQFTEPATPCEGEACRTSAASASSAASAGTASFVGPGNPKQASPSCKKSYVKRHDRCVKKQQKKKRNRNKSSRGKKGKVSKKKGRAYSSKGGRK